MSASLPSSFVLLPSTQNLSSDATNHVSNRSRFRQAFQSQLSPTLLSYLSLFFLDIPHALPSSVFWFSFNFLGSSKPLLDCIYAFAINGKRVRFDTFHLHRLPPPEIFDFFFYFSLFVSMSCILQSVIFLFDGSVILNNLREYFSSNLVSKSLSTPC